MTTFSKQILLKRMLAATVSLTAALASGGSQAATATANASANVLIPMTAAKVTDLNFGKIVEGNGTVTLNTSGARTKSGATAIPTDATASAAEFHLTGDTTNSFAITFTNPATLTGPAASTMATTWFWEVTATASSTGLTSGTPATANLTAGAAEIYVGGTVTVGVGQTPGTYTGTLMLSVDYN
jgi:hypothetical protein